LQIIGVDMTQDEIIEMARQSGWTDDLLEVSFVLPMLERFANLVAAKKQERIIEVVERLGTWAHITEVVAEIRGEA
jgi:hypothetical protein